MSTLWIALAILCAFAGYAAFIAIASWWNQREVERLIREIKGMAECPACRVRLATNNGKAVAHGMRINR